MMEVKKFVYVVQSKNYLVVLDALFKQGSVTDVVIAYKALKWSPMFDSRLSKR
jgi:hypothetical protein